jgi:hypothetical protein
MVNEQELDRIMMAYMPDSIKVAVATYGTHKLAEHLVGEELTLENVTAYLCTKVAERQERWKGIGDGLIALHQLQKAAATAPVPVPAPAPAPAPDAANKQKGQKDSTNRMAPPFSNSFPGYTPPPIDFSGK